MLQRRNILAVIALLAVLIACGETPERVEVTSAPPTTAAVVLNEAPRMTDLKHRADLIRWNAAVAANEARERAEAAAREAQERAEAAASERKRNAPRPSGEASAPASAPSGLRQPRKSFPSRDAMWEALAMCETGGDWQDGGDYGGGLGIYVGTWLGMGGGGEFAPRAQYATRAQQIIVAERIAQHGFGGWGCAEEVGLK